MKTHRRNRNRKTGHHPPENGGRFEWSGISAAGAAAGDIPELADLIDAPLIQSLMDDFYKLTRIPMTIVDLNGRLLVSVGWQEICTKFHRSQPDACKHCIESDLELSAGIRPGEFRRYKCRNNMWDIATPIMVGERHVGNIFSGQFFFDDETPDYDVFLAQARQYGFDQEEYLAALNQVPRLSRETVTTGMKFLVKLAEMISRLGHNSITLGRSLSERDSLMHSLQESREDLNRAQAVARTGSWRLDAGRNELLWSDETYRMFGISKEKPMTYETFLAAVHPDDRDYVRRKWSAALSGDPYDIEHRIVVHGAVRWVREKAVLEFDGDRLTGGFGTVQDITDRKQSERRIAHLASFPELNPFPIIETGLEGRITYINPAGKERFPDLVAQGFAHPLLAGWDEMIDELKKQNKPFLQREAEIEGTVYHQTVYYSPEVGLVRIYTIDITARKQTENSLRRSYELIKTIIDSMNDAISLIDVRNFTIAGVNKVFLEHYGYSDESEVIGKHCYEITHRRSDVCSPPNDICPLVETVKSKEHFSADHIHYDRHGTKIYVEVSTSPIKDEAGNVIQVVHVQRNITERKRAEQERERLLADLSRSNKELEQFAYVASHDLQEPIRMVASYVQLLDRKYHGKLDAKADSYIHFAVEGAGRMRKLIDGLLEYSRITRSGAGFGPVDMNRVFGAAVSNLSDVARENSAVITKDDLPVVFGDDTQLIQLVQNLIGNGIKYRRQDVPPAVHLSSKREGGDWIFSVRDNGIGIEPQYFQRIFQIFQRLHGRGEYPGTGIGLSICKRIVDRHHGRIWIESGPGEGATFFFTIPVSEKPDDS